MVSNAKMLQSKLRGQINSTKITKPNRQNNNHKTKKERKKTKVTDKQQTKNWCKSGLRKDDTRVNAFYTVRKCQKHANSRSWQNCCRKIPRKNHEEWPPCHCVRWWRRDMSSAIKANYSHLSIESDSDHSAFQLKKSTRRRSDWKLVKKGALEVCMESKLQALVYDILPSTTAVFSYAIGSWKPCCQLTSSFLLVLKQ